MSLLDNPKKSDNNSCSEFMSSKIYNIIDIGNNKNYIFCGPLSDRCDTIFDKYNEEIMILEMIIHI